MAYKGFKGIGPLKYGSPIKLAPPTGVESTGNVPPAGYGPAPGEALMSNEEVRSDQIDTKYGMQDVIPSGMTTGTDNHLEEVVLTAGPREKTRVEHRLDKTQAKLENSENTVGGGEKSNRLRRRAERLEKRADRQANRDKKKYARKDKKFWRDQEEQPKVQ